MIESIEIKNLRGIREGKLEGLTPLTILVGPNGCGKSTILDALLIGSHPDPVAAIVRAVHRQKTLSSAGRWLVHRVDRSNQIDVLVLAGRDKGRRCTLMWTGPSADNVAHFRCRVQAPDGLRCVDGKILLTPKGTFDYELDAGYPRVMDDVRFVEAASHEGAALHDLYSQAVEQGQKQQAIAIMTALLPNVRNIEILTEAGKPVLHVVFDDYSVPAALVGDGIHALLRLVLELAARRRGLVLAEEPELHQHPRAIGQSARAIVAAARAGIQVVLSTHSLEFIDYVLTVGDEKDLERLSVFRLKLDNGGLISSRLAGKDVAFARNQIEDDLR